MKENIDITEELVEKKIKGRKLSTKFDVGDTVYLLLTDYSKGRTKVVTSTVKNINVNVWSDGVYIKYIINTKEWTGVSSAAGNITKETYMEDELFATKEELLNSL